jgi:hypothetical protein
MRIGVRMEARMRVRPGGEESRRYRIPDVAIPIRGNPTRIILEPPLMVLWGFFLRTTALPMSCSSAGVMRLRHSRDLGG